MSDIYYGREGKNAGFWEVQFGSKWPQMVSVDTTEIRRKVSVLSFFGLDKQAC